MMHEIYEFYQYSEGIEITLERTLKTEYQTQRQRDRQLENESSITVISNRSE